MDASLAATARGAPARLGALLLRYPLPLCLALQACLLFADLGRLPPWGDEQASLARAALPLDDLRVALQDNVHPALYFLLLRAWLAGPCQFDSVICARALSAFLLLLATVAVDRLRLRHLDARTRAWFLALWALSPALLLYGRMARSYSLQLLLGALALEAGRRYAARHSAGTLLSYSAAAVALLFTHYLPAVAIVAAVTLVMSGRFLQRPSLGAAVAVLAPLTVIAAGSAGWLSAFASALGRVGGAAPYRVLGHPLLDAVASSAYTAVAFTIGESVQLWAVAVLAVCAMPIGMLLVRGAQQRPEWLAFAAPAAVIAFLGAHHWVSYAFVAGRLLFLLPYYLLLLALGGRAAPRLRAVVCSAVLLMSLGGAYGYFTQSGFLNKAYVIPVPAISRLIAESPDNASALVIVDHHSCNISLHPGQAQTIELVAQTSFDEIARLLADHQGPVWFVRSTHDVSPEGWNRRVEGLLADRVDARRHGFAPYSPLDRWLMRIAGWPEQPSYAVEVLELRRRGAGGGGTL